MPKILVTGAAGFIGSHLVDRLLENGWQVTGLDNFDPFYPPRVKQQNIAAHLHHPRYRLIDADIRNMDELRNRLPTRYDAIVHLAAKAGVRPSVEDPAAYQQTNIGGTQNVLDIARHCQTPHFVFASSSSVYGVNPKVPWSEEDNCLLPISPYASSKLSGELLGHVYSHLFGVRFVALRFFTVFGPRQRPDLAIHKFTSLLLSGKSIPIFGNGGTRRDYTFVSDIVDGIVAALAYTAAPYEIFNLGNNSPVNLLELIHLLAAVLGVTPNFEFVPSIPGDVPQTWACIEKAQRRLNYQPRVPLAVGLQAFAAWLKQQNEPRRPEKPQRVAAGGA